MNKLLLLITISFISLQFIGQIQLKLPSLINKVDPSVVKIYTIDSKNEYASQGSGVIISNNGICISNYHVLVGSKKAIAITASGKQFEISKILDYSKQNDLIKFKLDIGKEITTPVILNSLIPQRGVEVFALGYPNGFVLKGQSTATQGIISAIRDENDGKLIQTSAPITHGSSGGGLFDASGKLLGITSGTFAEDIMDRHANLNKVIPTLYINKLTKNLNITLLEFYESVKNNENYILGMIAYEQMDFKSASIFFRAHIDEYPEDATAWFRLGNSYNQLGRSSLNKELLNSALECFEVSISLDTNYYHAWGQSALVYSIIKEISLAKSFAFKAYQIEPNISFTNYVIGKVANEAKEYSLAVEFLGYAIINASDYDKTFLTHQWYLEKAIANSRLKRDYDAEQDFKSCLSLNSQNMDALFWYGNFLAIRNRIYDSCVQFKKLKQLSPNFSMTGTTIDEYLRYNKCY